MSFGGKKIKRHGPGCYGSGVGLMFVQKCLVCLKVVYEGMEGCLEKQSHWWNLEMDKSF